MMPVALSLVVLRSPDMQRAAEFYSRLGLQFTRHQHGTGVEQLTHDERVNWFPHLSPDGSWIVYLSFPPGTLGHPANKNVILRRMKPDGSEQSDIIAFLGGQGSINVNSWSPDSQRFAYVAFPVLSEK